MPTTYAHWRFGCDCIETLPENLKKTVNDNREIFDLGVHGPDIFFYDLSHPEIPKYGSLIHSEAGEKFFEKCIQVYKSYDDDKDAMLSYILGFLSHYCFDSQAHGYINKKDAITESLSHNLIESQYDGHLIRLDGKAISQTDRTKSLKPSKYISRIMSRFLPFTSDKIYRITKAQKTLLSLLNCKTNLKRKSLYKLLMKMNRKNHADLIVQTEELDKCRDSNLRIDKLKEHALILYPKLVNNLYDALTSDEKLLPYFKRNFDPIDDNAKILSYDEELKYIPEMDID